MVFDDGPKAFWLKEPYVKYCALTRLCCIVMVLYAAFILIYLPDTQGHQKVHSKIRTYKKNTLQN